MAPKESTRVDVPALLALPGPELVFGLIGAVGTDLAEVSRMLSEQLRRVNYITYEIRVSSLLHSLDRYGSLASPSSSSEYERIKAHMKAGSSLRAEVGKGDILALMSVSHIRLLRREHGSGADADRPRTPLPRNCVHHPLAQAPLGNRFPSRHLRSRILCRICL